ncbi:hypothetical protein AHiyo1_49720 [Arthrobacter sp. Hiyo1]|nr:hypothetical protein AHiyo1_49720 [Arthrobacter sp. Hiyo1]
MSPHTKQLGSNPAARGRRERSSLKAKRRAVELPVIASLYAGCALLGVTIYTTVSIWPIEETTASLLLIFSALIAIGLIGWAALLWFLPDPLPSDNGYSSRARTFRIEKATRAAQRGSAKKRQRHTFVRKTREIGNQFPISRRGRSGHTLDE